MKNEKKRISFDFKVGDEVDAKNISSLNFALVGDAVQSLYLRTWFVKNTTLNVNVVTKKINQLVNAGAQAKSFKLIEPVLNEQETEVCRRARNTHTHSVAKNYSVIEYRLATAFEALLGYLYLTNQIERLEFVLNYVLNNLELSLN